MTTLASDKPRAYELGEYGHIPMVATDIIYEGAAVGIDVSAGHARPLVAGDVFGGFADAKADNSTGAAAAINVRVRRHGLIQLAVAALAITDVGKAVYASDDDTFVLTKSTNTFVGRVVRFISSGVGIVSFSADRGGLGLLTPLTDNSGGATGDNTIAVITDPADTPATVDALRDDLVTNVVTPTRNAIADLVAKVNAIITLLA